MVEETLFPPNLAAVQGSSLPALLAHNEQCQPASLL